MRQNVFLIYHMKKVVCIGIYQKIEGCGGWLFPIWVSTVYTHVQWFTSLVFWR
jgi:hypothetical protein